MSVKEDVCIGIGYRNKGLKLPPLSYHTQPCRYWWKMWCMFPRVGCQCQLKRCWSLVDLCLAPELTSWYYQPAGASAYPRWSFYAKILTSKDVGSSSWRVQPTEVTRWIWEACTTRVSFLIYSVRWNRVTNILCAPKL